MEFKCLCCNADFTSNSNLRKHERSAKHVKMMEKLNAEPTENIRFRNTISELETENSTLKKRIAELENEVKNKQETINNIVKVVNKLASKPEPEATLHAEAAPQPEPEVAVIKHTYTPKPVPKSKKEKKQYYYEEYIYLKPEDVDYLIDNKLNEDDVHEINNFRSTLDYYRTNRDCTKEQIIEEYEELFSKRESPKFDKWKDTMQESSLEHIKQFLAISSGYREPEPERESEPEPPYVFKRKLRVIHVEPKPVVEPEESEEIRKIRYDCESLKHEDIEFIKHNNLDKAYARDMDDFKRLLDSYKDDAYTKDEIRNKYDNAFADPALKRWKESIYEASRNNLEEYLEHEHEYYQREKYADKLLRRAQEKLA